MYVQSLQDVRDRRDDWGVKGGACAQEYFSEVSNNGEAGGVIPD